MIVLFYALYISSSILSFDLFLKWSVKPAHMGSLITEVAGFRITYFKFSTNVY
jgi:hypothetical protein